MGSIIGDMFKRLGNGLGKVFDGDVIDGIGDVVGGMADTVGRTVGGALRIFGLDDGEVEPGTELLICSIALFAKLAKIDGRVDKSEIEFVEAFFAELEFTNDQKIAFAKFFNEVKADSSNPAEWAARATQIAVGLNPEDESLGLDIRLGIYRQLFKVALADGRLADSEVVFLREIADPLGLSDAAFDYVLGELNGGGSEDQRGALTDAYAVLGVSADASDDEVVHAYRRKLSVFHPDKIQGKNLDPEWEALANEKSSEINRAYEMIKEARSEQGCGVVMEDREDGIVVQCPSCGEGFVVPEDSDEYLFECPRCHTTVDITTIL